MESILVIRGDETFMYVKRKKKENKCFLAYVFSNVLPVLAGVDWTLLLQLEYGCYMLQESGEEFLYKHFKATIEFL